MFTKNQLEAMTVTELRELIKANEIKMQGAWSAKKAELVEAIFASQIEEIRSEVGTEDSEDEAYQAEVWDLIENEVSENEVSENEVSENEVSENTTEEDSEVKIEEVSENEIEVSENETEEVDEEFMTQIMLEDEAQIAQASTEATKPKKARKARKNKKQISVKQNDGTILIFASNRDFAKYFNEKYETNFRDDIAWYVIRDRNKKAKEVFEIDTIFEEDILEVAKTEENSTEAVLENSEIEIEEITEA